MELIVKNFGPIKDAHIQTKRYNVLIGNTSTGKSVLAKLISIAYEMDFYAIANGDYDGFYDLLKKYCIDFIFSHETIIEIKHTLAHWEIKKNSFKIVKSLGAAFSTQDVIPFTNTWEFIHELKKHVPEGDLSNINFGDAELKEADKVVTEFINNAADFRKTDLTNKSQFEIDFTYSAFVSLLHSVCASVYVPAERNLMSVFTNNIFSFLKSGSNIPESIKRFGSLYEAAKGENKNLSIDFMNIKVDFANENDKIVLDEAGTEIRFEQASSGMQSIIPLWTVFLYGIKNHSLGTAIIEEPELNLFPTLQVDLVDNLVAQLNRTKANLLITTHSPYILSVLDNLIYANDVYQKAKAANNEEQIQRIEKLLNPSMFINYDEVAAYLCKDDGVVERMNDDEMRNTGAYALDKASTITSHIFNELMDIENEL